MLAGEDLPGKAGLPRVGIIFAFARHPWSAMIRIKHEPEIHPDPATDHEPNPRRPPARRRDP